MLTLHIESKHNTCAYIIAMHTYNMMTENGGGACGSRVKAA